MVVVLATDVLFGSGSASLSKDGKAAIVEVAGVLAGIPRRAFQIEGHTDAVPIASAQFPSNWELASARAITVVETMIEAGVKPERVSAASFADSRPVQKNESVEGRKGNRRIEIVVLPDLSTLPGFEELQKLDSK
jgi:chemotaxis protein MotB